ncbi:MAG: hypothetical protein R6U31_02545 [bacterium]
MNFIDIIAFIIFLIVLSVLFYRAIEDNSREYLSRASFVTGLFQSLMVFIIFFFAFQTVSTGMSILSHNIEIRIMTMDILFIHIYIFLYYVYSFKHSDADVSELNDLLQLFIPVIALNGAVLLIIKFDTDANQIFYRYLVMRYFSIIVFKIIYIMAHFIFLDIILGRRRNPDN